MKIINYDRKYQEQMLEMIKNIRWNEIGWKSATPDLEDIKGIYLKDKGNFWLALDDDKVIGTIGLKDMSNDQGYLQRMYVDKEYRGTGLAVNLLNTLLDFAKDKGFKEIYLGTEKRAQRAIHFYEKLGLERIEGLPENFQDRCDTDFFKITL